MLAQLKILLSSWALVRALPSLDRVPLELVTAAESNWKSILLTRSTVKPLRNKHKPPPRSTGSSRFRFVQFWPQNPSVFHLFGSLQNPQATSGGVPSKIKAVKVTSNAGNVFNDLVVTNTDNPPEVSETHFVLFLYRQKICVLQSTITRPGREQKNLVAVIELYGTEADPTNIDVVRIQWGKDDDANMISCGT